VGAWVIRSLPRGGLFSHALLPSVKAALHVPRDNTHVPRRSYRPRDFGVVRYCTLILAIRPEAGRQNERDTTMSKLETPMILRFWETVGGTLIPEFQAVARSPGVGRRLVDAVILPNRPKGRAHWRDLDIAGEDVIAVQAKAKRLGMYLVGQGLFSADWLRAHRPKSIRSIILCSADDLVLRPLLARFPEVEVVVDAGAPVLPSEEEIAARSDRVRRVLPP
jgi:hypothetical protein